MSSLAHTGQLLSLLSDPTRARLLSLLSEEELTVAELTAILEVGQSRISTHLGRLKEADLVRDRRSGTSAYYRIPSQLEPTAEELWNSLRSQIDDPLIERDRERARQHRLRRNAAWPESLAG